jgi:hypothetical protein
MTRKTVRRATSQKDTSFEIPNRDAISRILGTVAPNKAFFFYNEIGKPTGDTAVSLLDFYNKINTLNPQCLAFHTQRGDFENWIRETIGDLELSQRIDKLKTKKATWKNPTTLQHKLQNTIKERIEELQDIWPNTLTLPQPLIAEAAI